MKKDISKEQLVKSLEGTLKLTRAGGDIKSLTLEDNNDSIRIKLNNGYEKLVNIACDSGIAIVEDVTRALKRM